MICCHCRMDKSFFKKALRCHTKKKFRTNPQWEILFQKRMVESNQTKQEKKLCQITDGSSVLR